MTVRHRLRTRLPLGLVLGSTAVSVLGSAVSTVVLPLLVLHLTGSAFHLGLVGAFEAAGLIIGNTLGGALADRLGARRVSMAASLSAGAVLALVPLAWGAGLLGVAVLCGLGLLANACGSTGGMARRGLVADAAGRGEVSIDRAEALYQALLTAGYVAGLAAAGLLVTVTDLATLIWIDVASFAVTAARPVSHKALRASPTVTAMLVSATLNSCYTGWSLPWPMSR